MPPTNDDLSAPSIEFDPEQPYGEVSGLEDAVFEQHGRLYDANHDPCNSDGVRMGTAAKNKRTAAAEEQAASEAELKMDLRRVRLEEMPAGPLKELCEVFGLAYSNAGAARRDLADIQLRQIQTLGMPA